jgi:hypothetical protein
MEEDEIEKIAEEIVDLVGEHTFAKYESEFETQGSKSFVGVMLAGNRIIHNAMEVILENCANKKEVFADLNILLMKDNMYWNDRTIRTFVCTDQKDIKKQNREFLGIKEVTSELRPQ